ncbi:hypothetical protein MRB53_039593 [Persea americana]|nr:hypothetical protein MRB53_039593 [Persea americana]
MVAEEDFDQVLKAENAEFLKDQEIDRILKAFKLDAYAVLDILPGCTTKDIRNIFRKKSLLIHPDKTSNEKAPGNDFHAYSYTDKTEAFDKLKRAESELMDDKQRERIDSAIATARRMLINERKWTVDHPDLTTDEFMYDLRDKTREVLIDDELHRRRKRQLQMAKKVESGQKRKRLTRPRSARSWRTRCGRRQEMRVLAIGENLPGQASVLPEAPPPPPPPPTDGQPLRKKVKKVKKEKIKLLG